MDLVENVYSILVVSSSEKFNQSIKPVLAESRYSPVKFVFNSSEARRTVLEEKFDIIIINTPLKDEFGTSLALDLCESTSSGVMLLVKAEHYHDLTARVMPHGVFTVSKPTNSAMISQALVLLCSTRERLRKMEKKTATIEEKMEEIRIVNRAKCVLIEQLKMTEKEAHRFIEKQAMDRCETKRSVAEKIISTYQ